MIDKNCIHTFNFIFVCFSLHCVSSQGFGNCSSTDVTSINIHDKEDWKFIFPGPHHTNISDDITCQWRISAPSGFVIELSIQEVLVFDADNSDCSNASLSIYNGYDASSTLQRKVCTNTTSLLTLQYTSTQYQYLHIYKNDLHNVEIFVKLSFSAKTPYESPFGYSGRTVTGIVVGVVAGIIFLISLITTVVLCCMAHSDYKKRKRRNKYKESSTNATSAESGV